LTAWTIWPFTELLYLARIDWWWVFSDKVSGSSFQVNWLWETWWTETWWEPTGWELTYEVQRQPFDRYADEGRIYQDWTRIELEIRSSSLIQDFLIDILWVRAEQTNNIDIKDKF